MKRQLMWSAVGLGCVLAGTSMAHATVQNQLSYKKAYPNQDPKTYSCTLCHQAIPGSAKNLNVYGTALKAFKGESPAPANALTIEDYTQFDAADLDKDGATNRQELDAGTDPLDPASIPPPAAPVP